MPVCKKRPAQAAPEVTANKALRSEAAAVAQFAGGALTKHLSSDWVAWRNSLGYACKFLKLAESESRNPSSAELKTLEDCRNLFAQSLVLQGTEIPQITLIAQSDDWGKTGSSSSQEDMFAVVGIGKHPCWKALGITLAYSLDGPDSDDSDYWCDSDDDGATNSKAKPKYTESFDIEVVEMSDSAVNELWNSGACEEEECSSSGFGNHISHAISDASEEEILSMSIAGNGENEVSKFDRKRLASLATQCQCTKQPEILLAMALRAIAQKHKHLKPLNKAFSRKKGVPASAASLFKAFAALPKRSVVSRRSTDYAGPASAGG